ncbi:hypothetical protein ACK302_16980, partial [Aeromonas caviae]
WIPCLLSRGMAMAQRRCSTIGISYLESVVNYRNDMAHEFLLNDAITQSMANFSGRKLYGDLFRAIYELEQIIILYDWCEENNGWQ